MLIDDIEYVIFRHPDLAQIREFMLSYGLLDLEQTAEQLYLRSYGDAPFSYVTTKGDAAFVGMGFRVASLDALETISARFKSKIDDSPHPGGGLIVVGSDPDGRRLEFVFDAARLAPVPSNGAPIVWNDAFAKNRRGHFQRPAYGPSHVQRLGHAAIFTTDAPKLIAWYSEILGMKPSEMIHSGNEAEVVASFMHLDRGDAWTDHHTIAIVGAAKPGLDHVSFECRDFDDVGMGHMLHARQGPQASLGHWPAFLRQSGLRLLDRSGGLPCRAFRRWRYGQLRHACR